MRSFLINTHRKWVETRTPLVRTNITNPLKAWELLTQNPNQPGNILDELKQLTLHVDSHKRVCKQNPVLAELLNTNNPAGAPQQPNTAQKLFNQYQTLTQNQHETPSRTLIGWLTETPPEHRLGLNVNTPMKVSINLKNNHLTLQVVEIVDSHVRMLVSVSENSLTPSQKQTWKQLKQGNVNELYAYHQKWFTAELKTFQRLSRFNRT